MKVEEWYGKLEELGANARRYQMRILRFVGRSREYVEKGEFGPRWR